MTIKEKRTKIETMVLGAMSRIDKTGSNSDRYRKFFKSMSDEQFSKWANSFLKDDEKNFYMEFLPYKNEPVLQDLQDAGDYLKIPLDEYIYYRSEGNKDNPIRSAYKCPVGYIIIKKLQQMLVKKNSYNLDINRRNLRTNQLTSADKVARITEAESYALQIYNSEYAMQELYGPRADDSVSKLEMYKQISSQGYCQLKDLTNDLSNKYTLNTVNDFLMGCGLMSDLVTDTLELPRTIEERRVRKSSIENNAQKNDNIH